MSKLFIVANFNGSFGTEAEAKAAIEAIFAGTDQQRPPEKRFALEAYRKASFRTLEPGVQWLEVEGSILAFLIMPNQKGGVWLLNSGNEWCFTTREEAQELVDESEAVGHSIGLFIVEQTVPD